MLFETLNPTGDGARRSLEQLPGAPAAHTLDNEQHRMEAVMVAGLL
jgi:hypothetical protein